MNRNCFRFFYNLIGSVNFIKNLRSHAQLFDSQAYKFSIPEKFRFSSKLNS